MKKIRNVEMFRLIFMIQIVLMHLMNSNGLFKTLPFSVPLYSHLNSTTKNGYLCVDYFFIMAGFFLVLTFKDISVYSFVMGKIKRFLPTMIIALVAIRLLSYIYGDTSFNWYRFFYTVSFTASLGFMPSGGIGYSWFIGSLFWGLLFYFYCIKHFDKKYLSLIFGTIIIFSYALLVNNTSAHFSNVRPNIFGFLNIGLLRAVAGIGVGYFIGNVYKENLDKIRAMKSTVIQKAGYTLIEAGLLFFIIYYETFRSLKHNPMLFIIAFTVLFILFLINQGYISNFFDNNISAFLGKYVFTIYILEEAFETYLRILIPTLDQKSVGGGQMFLLGIIMSLFLISVIVYHAERKMEEIYEKYRLSNG